MSRPFGGQAMSEVFLERAPKLYSPLTLAFLGDAVYELWVRKMLVAQGEAPVDKLHKQKVELVKASAQSAAFEEIEKSLTPQELAVYKRGRNAHTAGVPKNTQVADYRRATGMEALFGYLYLMGQFKRIDELFSWITEAKEM